MKEEPDKIILTAEEFEILEDYIREYEDIEYTKNNAPVVCIEKYYVEIRFYKNSENWSTLMVFNENSETDDGEACYIIEARFNNEWLSEEEIYKAIDTVKKVLIKGITNDKKIREKIKKKNRKLKDKIFKRFAQ